jgi:acetylornithine/succinyldiaminopimelate/putrescine aminotransferase
MRAILDGDLMANAAQAGDYFLSGLNALQAKHDLIAAVRGRGLMLAFDLREAKAADIVGLARDRGLLVNNTGPSTIRMVPPLILTHAHIDEALGILDCCFGGL